MSALMILAGIVSVVWQWALCLGRVGQDVALWTGGPRADRIWRAFARIHQELWLVAPPGLVIGAVHIWHSDYPWIFPIFALALWQWWRFRDWPDDENRWKRRGRKLKDAVAERAGRLVVVPS